MSTRIHALDGIACAPYLAQADGDPQATLDALLKAAGRATWRGPGGRMFINLQVNVTIPEEAPEAVHEVWNRLLAIVNPQRERAFNGPVWLRRLDGHDENVTSPSEVGALLSLLDREPSALETIVEACREGDQEAEGDALQGLVDFLRQASLAGWWILGVEQT